MRKSKYGLIVLTLLLTACKPITGKIVDKWIDPAHTEYSIEKKCWGNDEDEICTYVPVSNYVPDRYYFRLCQQDSCFTWSVDHWVYEKLDEGDYYDSRESK